MVRERCHSFNINDNYIKFNFKGLVDLESTTRRRVMVADCPGSIHHTHLLLAVG